RVQVVAGSHTYLGSFLATHAPLQRFWSDAQGTVASTPDMRSTAASAPPAPAPPTPPSAPTRPPVPEAPPVAAPSRPVAESPPSGRDPVARLVQADSSIPP